MILEERIRIVKSFMKTVMKKIKVKAQVPDGGKTMKPSFHFTTRITTPYPKA